MQNLLKLVKKKRKRCISRLKIRTIHTILRLKKIKSLQSVHFGHPVNAFDQPNELDEEG